MIDLRALRVAVTLAYVLVAFVFGGAAWGAYPEKAVRVIVPSPPGGGNDVMARLAGQKLTAMDLAGSPAAVKKRVLG